MGFHIKVSRITLSVLLLSETWNPTDKTHVVDFDLRLPAEAILGSAKAIIGVMGKCVLGGYGTELGDLHEITTGVWQSIELLLNYK